jgi:acyl carrier protein phosphodiesterase
MNYLAHAWLSFNDPGVLVGNMISDFLKGKARYGFPPAIAAGIELHRRIDDFTDSHPATAAAKEFFRADYRLYSAPIVDVVYDHFLANDAAAFGNEGLHAFTQQVYAQLESRAEWLPPRFAAIFPHMRTHNWLYYYKERDGIARSLAGLARRSAYMPPPEAAVATLHRHYDAIGDCYRQIAPAVKDFAKAELQRILT